MSSNIPTLDQAQAVDPAPEPGFPQPSSDLSVSLPNNGGPQDDVPNADPTEPPADDNANANANANANDLWKPYYKPLADLIAWKGIVDGCEYAVRYHREVLKHAVPVTANELNLRLLDVPAILEEKYHKHHQGSANSVAIRLLMDRPGEAYAFEKDAT